jgi:hypothetical protein
MGKFLGDFIFADKPGELNTSLFRCAIPFKYLGKAGYEANLMHYSQIDYLKLSPTVLMERIVFPSSNTPDSISILRRAGVEWIVATFDDAYQVMPDSCGESKAFWDKDRLMQFKVGLAMCDRVVVPSARLAEDYQPFCNISVLPNYHDDDLWPDLPHKEKEVITIGWGGTDGHLETWKKSPLVPAMKILKKKYGDKINFLMAGKVSQYILEQDIACAFIPTWVPIGQWPNVVRSFDIGLAPLSGAYDMRRSALKVIEYGLAGIPFVASNAGEYANISKEYDGARDFLCKTTDDWVSSLSSLVDIGLEERSWVGRMNRRWAENYLMSKHTQEYVDVLSH